MTIGARVDRLAVRLGEHPAALLPFGASMVSVTVVLLAVFMISVNSWSGTAIPRQPAADWFAWPTAPDHP